MQLPSDAVSNTRTGLFIALGVFTVGYLVVLVRALRERAAAGEEVRPRVPMSIVSFIANFFDTLGIGSYATTTSMVRQWRLIPDEKIPGSLNVGYVLPTVLQAFIYTKLVPVDPKTLIFMIVASVLGAWLGAGVVASWPRRNIQIGMGLALLGFVGILVVKLAFLPAGGDALGLVGSRLVIGVAVNFVLGAFMTLGIGLYAPCMILVSLLGMNATTAFPIMMGSCAFLMPVAVVRFVRAKAFEPKAILSMVLPGIPAVLIAAFLVTSLPLTAVNWLVVLVVTYTGVNMLRTAARERSMAATKRASAEAAVAG